MVGGNVPQRETWIGRGFTGSPTPRKDNPRKRSTVTRDRIALRELYHNPDPLYRFIGEPNETTIIVENETVKGLIDSGAQISSISDKFAEALNLEVRN